MLETWISPKTTSRKGVNVALKDLFIPCEG